MSITKIKRSLLLFRGHLYRNISKEVEPFQPTNPTNESQSKYQKNHPLSQPGPFTFQIFRWVTPGHDSAIHFDTSKSSYRGLDLLNPKSTTITTSTHGGWAGWAVVGENVGTVDRWDSQPSPGKSYHILESLSESNLLIKPYQLV